MNLLTRIDSNVDVCNGGPLQNKKVTTESYSFKYRCNLKTNMTSKHEVSKKYKQIFEVINRIYKYGFSTEKNVRSSRIIAQKELDDEWGIRYNSIMDKYSKRKLGVNGSKEFDTLVHMFLNNRDMALRNRCLNVSKKSVDDDAIRSFFNQFNF